MPRKQLMSAEVKVNPRALLRQSAHSHFLWTTWKNFQIVVHIKHKLIPISAIRRGPKDWHVYMLPTRTVVHTSTREEAASLALQAAIQFMEE